MLSVLQTKSIDFLDSLVQRLEAYEDVSKRNTYFSNKCMHQDHHHHHHEHHEEHEVEEHYHEHDVKEKKKDEELDPKDKFKHLSFELIDIGIHGGETGIKYIKKTNLYTATDKYMKYEEKAELVKEKSVQAFNFLNDKVYNPLKENIYVFYDQSTHYFQVLIKLINEKQAKVIDYVKENYENVQIFVNKNWLRLDFNDDGQVSAEDLKKSFQNLYEFLKNYEYYEKAVEIKCKLYDEAIKYMKKENEADKKEKVESKEENDKKDYLILDDDNNDEDHHSDHHSDHN